MNIHNTLIWVLICLLYHNNVKCTDQTLSQTSGTETGTKKSSDNSKNEGIDLDINNKKSGTGYDYYGGSYDCHSFTAKENKFKSVKEGSTVIWSTTNSSEYASSVRVMYGDNIIILMGNGTKKTFNKETGGCSCNCKWSWCCCLTCGIYNCCAKSWKEEVIDAPTKTDNSNTNQNSGSGKTGTGGGNDESSGGTPGGGSDSTGGRTTNSSGTPGTRTGSGGGND